MYALTQNIAEDHELAEILSQNSDTFFWPHENVTIMSWPVLSLIRLLSH